MNADLAQTLVHSAEQEATGCRVLASLYSAIVYDEGFDDAVADAITSRLLSITEDLILEASGFDMILSAIESRATSESVQSECAAALALWHLRENCAGMVIMTHH